MASRLRSHQLLIDGIMRSIAAGETDIRNVLAAITPGGGKSLLPVLAATHLIREGVVDRVCWVVPRDTLRRQAEEAFVDPTWRHTLGHAITVRAADNSGDPCRGLNGYVTTYQSIAAAPDMHLAEFHRHRYLIAVDEIHHLPALADLDVDALASEETAWSRALAPLLELAHVRLMMSGTLERADGRPILWLPYRREGGTMKRKHRRIDFSAPGWAIVGYSRRQALAERAVIPIRFGAMEGEATWKPKRNSEAPAPATPVSLSADPTLAKYALYTAFRTEFADQMLRHAFDACRTYRAERRVALGLPPGASARGLGKLLIVASDQEIARRYARLIENWLPQRSRQNGSAIATSDSKDPQAAIAAFRMRPEPSTLITVAMAYEGMDCPGISHLACLTHIRSRPWLEQLVARATRVDPEGGAWDAQRAVVYHPDDILFRRFRHAMETEQGTRARLRSAKERQGDLFDEEEGNPDGERGWGMGIEPLRSNWLATTFSTVAPGPDFTARTVTSDAVQEAGMPPSIKEAELRRRVGQMVAAQVVEDEDNNLVVEGPTGYHAYNAVLKSVMGGRRRSEWTIEELESALGWLERNRISEHRACIEDDPRYKWSSRRARSIRRPHGMATIQTPP